MFKFKCSKCGSNELVYESWVRCRKQVVIQTSGHIEYFDTEIDDTDELPVDCRYVCGCCGKPPLLYGNQITNEAELVDYLKMTIGQRIEMEAETNQLLEQQALSELNRLEENETNINFKE